MNVLVCIMSRESARFHAHLLSMCTPDSDSSRSVLAARLLHSEALDAMPDDLDRQLVAALRVLCMAIGAGLLLLPSAASRGQGREDEGDIERARSYLHYVHSESRQAPEPALLDHKGFFVPAGWDSKYNLDMLVRYPTPKPQP